MNIHLELGLVIVTDQEIIILKDVEEYFDKYRNLSYKAYFKNNKLFIILKVGKLHGHTTIPKELFKRRNNKRVIEDAVNQLLKLIHFRNLLKESEE